MKSNDSDKDKQPLIDFIKQNIPNIIANNNALAIIADNFEENEFVKNEYFLKEGKVSDYLYLAEGFMRAFTFDTDGNEVTTYF